jgi:hypothetical protein
MLLAGGAVGAPATAQTASADVAKTPLQLVNEMVAHENDEAAHHDRYEYVSTERSDRTGGHLWTERVVETESGNVKMLVAEDGKPLSAARQQQEREKLAGMMADPEAMEKKEQEKRNEEAHARMMLATLGRAFVFDNVRLTNGVWRMDFHPNPAYSPSGIEERVLHGMSGWLAIDAKQQRLLHLEASLPQDVSIGFGLLATIRAGSHVVSDRMDEDGHWRTVHVVTDIRGKAVLFKSVSKNCDVTRSDFHFLNPGTTVAQAVGMLEGQVVVAKN